MKKAIDNDNFELARELMDGSEVHVCKNSGGWLPLFQAQKGLWESVAEIKRHYSIIHPKIVDEYGKELTWEDFEKNFINWNGGYDGAIPKTPYKQDLSLPYSDPDMPAHRPVSHFEYGNGKNAHMYFKDSEGYEFTWSEFS